MPVNRNQIFRLVKIVSELKQNCYPNKTTLVKKFEKAELEEGLKVNCSDRTIGRDIEILKVEFNAPIRFDYQQNGYYLTNSRWEFICPAMCENMLAFSLLGARIVEDIAPQPLKKMVRDSVDEELMNNSSEFLDEAFVKSLIVASGIKAHVEANVFQKVFDGWRSRKAIKFTYNKVDGSKSDRYFEPHLISFHKGIWYTKGISITDDAERVFAVQRISNVEVTDKTFEINKTLLESVEQNGLFNYPKLHNIQLLCDSSIGFYLREHKKIKKFEIAEHESGNLLIKLAPAIEHEVIRWVLGESGKIKVLEPASLREKVITAAKKVAEANSNI